MSASILQRRALASATLALLLATTAQAAPPAPLHWLCWLEDGATTLACAQEAGLLDALFDDPVLQDEAAGRQRPDPRAILRAGSVTAALRQQAGAAPPTVWRTPLYSPAHDDEFTAELARAVMCGRQPDCRVLFRPGAPLEAGGPEVQMRVAATADDTR
jgi:hypothetical protein